MPTDDWERGYAAGWRAAQRDDVRDITRDLGDSTPSPKPKRKASAYSKRYGAAFRKLSPKYKLKNGSWGKDGFKRCQKAAHKLAGRK
jgi:hypothetical protein